MSSSTTSLSAAAADRKARLAQLKSLKRKSPPPGDDDAPSVPEPGTDTANPYLSGRNFDSSTRGPKLGFERAPASSTSTAEARAAALADEATAQREADEAKKDAPLDLFSLQPKKANWDLKRELDRRMDESGLNAATENAIAKLVRERIQGQKKAGQKEVTNGDADGNGSGMEGSVLVEATREREKEDEEEARRERELDAELEAP